MREIDAWTNNHKIEVIVVKGTYKCFGGIEEKVTSFAFKVRGRVHRRKSTWVGSWKIYKSSMGKKGVKILSEKTFIKTCRYGQNDILGEF